jgi:peptidoglycan/LPS O-acetylase OafA/YrhL
MPPLWISVLLFGAGSAAGLLPWSGDPIAVFLQLFFGANYAEPFGHADGVPGMPLWSLAVEEHYYLIFPALFLLLVRKLDVRRLALIFSISCLVALGLRLVHVFAYSDVYYTYYFTHTRFDSIMFGAILALWNNPVLERNAWRPGLWQFASAVLLLAITIIPRNEAFRETIRYSLQGVLLFVVFSWILTNKGWISRILSSPAFQIVGRYSYTIYLSHYFFIKAVSYTWPTLDKVLVGGAAAILTMSYSAAMYKFVERPAGLLRHKLNPVERARSDAAKPSVGEPPSLLPPGPEAPRA